MQNVNITLK